MRLFVGIPLSPAAIRQLSALSMRLRSKDDGLRWSTPELWHITLHFLGETSREQYTCIVAGLRNLHSPPVPIQLDSLGSFERAGVFFASVRLTPGLITLQQQVTAATVICGFPAEAREYRPHITLARSKDKEGGRAIKRLKHTIHLQTGLTGFIAREFLLYESLLGSSGSHHEVRECFPFTNI